MLYNRQKERLVVPFKALNPDFPLLSLLKTGRGLKSCRMRVSSPLKLIQPLSSWTGHNYDLFTLLCIKLALLRSPKSRASDVTALLRSVKPPCLACVKRIMAWLVEIRPPWRGALAPHGTQEMQLQQENINNLGSQTEKMAFVPFCPHTKTHKSMSEGTQVGLGWWLLSKVWSRL